MAGLTFFNVLLQPQQGLALGCTLGNRMDRWVIIVLQSINKSLHTNFANWWLHSGVPETFCPLTTEGTTQYIARGPSTAFEKHQTAKEKTT